MERKIIKHTDFIEIGKNNEYFLWHFLQKDQEKHMVNIFSIFKEKEDSDNLLNDILEKLDISYYESYVEESIDFLISSGTNQKVWEPPIDGANPDPKYLFKPIILLYKGSSLKSSTFQSCYCPEGIIDMIGKENPDLLSGF